VLTWLLLRADGTFLTRLPAGASGALAMGRHDLSADLSLSLDATREDMAADFLAGAAAEHEAAFDSDTL
jgi:hypothetical protein